MGQLILRKTDGSEITLRENIADNTMPIDIIVRNECIATKIWCEDDIINALIESGYKGTEQELAIVMNGQDWDGLNDCTDDEWEIIYQAIDSHKDELEKIESAQNNNDDSREQN